jgi:hypothetical protein
MEAFGQDKSQRYGEESCGPAELRLRPDDDDEDGKRDPLNDIQVQQVMKARQRMREYFDLYYYSLKAANADDAKGSSKSPIFFAVSRLHPHLIFHSKFSRIHDPGSMICYFLIFKDVSDFVVGDRTRAQGVEFILRSAQLFQLSLIDCWNPTIAPIFPAPWSLLCRSVSNRTRNPPPKI